MRNVPTIHAAAFTQSKSNVNFIEFRVDNMVLVVLVFDSCLSDTQVNTLNFCDTTLCSKTTNISK